MGNMSNKYPILSIAFQCSWSLALACIVSDILQLFIFISLADQISELVKLRSLANSYSQSTAASVILKAVLSLALKILSSALFHRLNVKLRERLFVSFLFDKALRFDIRSFDLFTATNGYFDSYCDSIVRTSLGIWTNAAAIIMLGSVTVRSLADLNIPAYFFVPLILVFLLLILTRKLTNQLSEPIVGLASRRDQYLNLMKNNQSELRINSGFKKLVDMTLHQQTRLYKRIALTKSIEALLPDILKLLLVFFLGIFFYQGSANSQFLSKITKVLLIASALQPAIVSLAAISSKLTYLNSLVLKHSRLLR